GASMHLANASSLYDHAVVEFDNGTQKETVVVADDGVAGNVVTFTTALANTYFEGHKARVVEMEIAARYKGPDGRIVATETIPNLRLHDDHGPSFVETSVRLQSALVNVVTVPPANGGGYSETNLAQFPTSPTAEWVDLTGGNDNLAQLTVDDFVGVDGG